MRKISNDELGLLAYEKVKKMILSRKFSPGDKIVQEKLAADLGISRTPLRSALQMLEGEYLVEAIPRKGVYVRVFSDQEIVDIYDCRIALECMAIELLAQRALPGTLDRLKHCFTGFDQTKEIDREAYQKADMRFHDLIIESSGNQFLCQMFRRSNLLTCIDRIGLVRAPSETLPEHLAILQALEEGKPKHAAQILRLHLLKSRDLIDDRIVKQVN